MITVIYHPEGVAPSSKLGTKTFPADKQGQAEQFMSEVAARHSGSNCWCKLRNGAYLVKDTRVRRSA